MISIKPILILIVLLMGITKCFSQTDSLTFELKQKHIVPLITVAPVPDSTKSVLLKEKKTLPSGKQFTGLVIGVVLIFASSILIFYIRSK